MLNDLLSQLFPLLTGCGRMQSSNITLVTVISKVRVTGCQTSVTIQDMISLIIFLPYFPCDVMDLFCCTFITFVPATYRVWQNAVQ